MFYPVNNHLWIQEIPNILNSFGTKILDLHTLECFHLIVEMTTSPLSSITSPLSSASATQFKQNKVQRRPINVLPSQQSPLDPRNTQHPQQFWDKNSGFTYTGMFSSDC